jgi:hypothetical protein
VGSVEYWSPYATLTATVVLPTPPGDAALRGDVAVRFHGAAAKPLDAIEHGVLDVALDAEALPYNLGAQYGEAMAGWASAWT